MTAKTISTILTGTGSLGLTGTYASSFRELQSVLKDDLLDQEENQEEWKALQKKLNEKEGLTEDENIGVKSAKNEGSNSDKIKEWCKNKHRSIVNQLFPTPFQKKLLTYVKEFCIFTIEDKIEKSKRVSFSGDADMSTFRNKFNVLKSSNDDENLNEELVKIKESKTEQSWTKLRNWCERSYKRGYKKSRDELLQLVQKYCQK